MATQESWENNVGDVAQWWSLACSETKVSSQCYKNKGEGRNLRHKAYGEVCEASKWDHKVEVSVGIGCTTRPS